MSVKTALRKVSRAFRANDANAFEEAMDDLEEEVGGKDEGGGQDPDTIEVHNHIPDSRDTALGELPSLNGGEKAFDEAPPWFDEHKKATDAMLKKMSDDIASLKGGGSPVENNDEFLEPEEEDLDADGMSGEGSNLEMDRRRNNDRGRRNQDEPAERQEMAERIRENGGNDQANREILGELQFEAPPGTGDSKARKARDSALLEDAFQETLSRAEVLAPGIRLPTFDRAAPPVRTARAMFALRRTALDLAYNKPETRGVIDSALSGRTFDSKRLPIGQTRVLFSATAAAIAAGNNTRATDHATGFNNQPRGGASVGIQSTADINKRNMEKYGRGAK